MHLHKEVAVDSTFAAVDSIFVVVAVDLSYAVVAVDSIPVVQVH